MLDAAGFNGDSPDSAKARKGFLFYDAANPDMKGSYKEPFADIIDGDMKAVKGGLDAAASRLPQTDVPQAARDEGQKVLDAYKKADGSRAAPKRRLRAAGARGLYQVAWLAQIMDDLDFLQWCVNEEAGYEGDNSDLPATLLSILHDVGKALVAMAIEETQEIIADRPALDVDIAPIDDDMVASASACIKRAIVSMVRQAVAPRVARMNARAVAGADPATLALMLRHDMLSPCGRVALADLIMSRSGKVLSGDNEAMLRSACEHMQNANDAVMGVVQQNYPDAENAPQPTEDTEARALRVRRARAALAAASAAAA